jgi:hypothetical protein
MSPTVLKSLMARTRASSVMLGEALGIRPVQIRKWRTGTRPVPEHHINSMRSFFAERAAQLGIDPRTLPEIPERVDLREIAPAAAVEEPESPPTRPARVRRASRLPRTPSRRRAASGDPKPAGSPPPGRTSTSTPPPSTSVSTSTASGSATLIEAINAGLALLRPAKDDPRPSPPSLPSPLSQPPPEILPPLRLIVPAQSQQRRKAQTIEALALAPLPVPFTPPRGPRCAWFSTAPGEQGRCGQIAAPGSPLCAMHQQQVTSRSFASTSRSPRTPVVTQFEIGGSAPHLRKRPLAKGGAQ